MNLAIIGSKRGMNKTVFKYWIDYYIHKWGKPLHIISTGEKGIGEMARQYAVNNDIRLKIIYADAFRGIIGEIERNNLIVKECTHCIAFPAKNSKPTWDIIRKVSEENKKLKIKQI